MMRAYYTMGHPEHVYLESFVKHTWHLSFLRFGGAIGASNVMNVWIEVILEYVWQWG